MVVCKTTITPTLKPIHDKILEALGVKGNQSFAELSLSTGLDKGNLWRGLKELEKYKTWIKEKNNLYSISKIRNRVLLCYLRKANIKTSMPQDVAKALRESKDPFEEGGVFIASFVKIQSRLTLEQHSAGLSDYEKFLFEKLIRISNETIKVIFDVLEKLNYDQTADLRAAMGMVLNPPADLYNANALAPSQKRAVFRIIGKAQKILSIPQNKTLTFS